MAFPTAKLKDFYRKYLIYEEEGIQFWIEFSPFKLQQIKFVVVNGEEREEYSSEIDTDQAESLRVAMNAVDRFNLMLRLKRGKKK